MKKWIFLSSHFDDVVLSAGGMVWELTRRGDQVEIWTMCAGDPPDGKPLSDYAQMLHLFWELGDDVPFRRSQEDAACCQVLGAALYRRYTVPDNIYRTFPQTGEPVVKVPDDNMGPLEPDEIYLIPPPADFIVKNYTPGAELVSPLAIGHHRDHVLTRKAAERAAAKLGIPLWHYVDYPYVVQGEYKVEDFVPKEAEQFKVDITPEGLKAWGDGFACHKSQIHLFWADEAEMRQDIERYFKNGLGFTLYKF